MILKLLVGLIEKDRGSIYIQGKDISTRSMETRSICGYMPQSLDLDLDLSIFENISLYAQLNGLNTNEAQKNTMHWIELLGLENFKNKKVKRLSYGLQKKVLLARSLSHNPDVLLLDEPTTGMDPKSRSAVWNILDNLHQNTQLHPSVFLIKKLD